MKEKDKEVEKAVEVGHEQVEVALLEKFDVMKAEEAEVQGIVVKVCVQAKWPIRPQLILVSVA